MIKLNNFLQKVKELLKIVKYSWKEKLNVSPLRRTYLHIRTITCLSIQSYSSQMISIWNLFVMVTWKYGTQNKCHHLWIRTFLNFCDIVKGLVKDVLVIDEYEDEKLSKSFQRVWIVDIVITEPWIKNVILISRQLMNLTSKIKVDLTLISKGGSSAFWKQTWFLSNSWFF